MTRSMLTIESSLPSDTITLDDYRRARPRKAHPPRHLHPLARVFDFPKTPARLSSHSQGRLAARPASPGAGGPHFPEAA